MSGGNTLLAHVVGSGKTNCMAAMGMKMKQAGLIKKPIYCVPNHMLEQFAREFQQLYPNAKLLVAGKEGAVKK
jgi:N12 class adenine-specific DNA methylase